MKQWKRVNHVNEIPVGAMWTHCPDEGETYIKLDSRHPTMFSDHAKSYAMLSMSLENGGVYGTPNTSINLWVYIGDTE